MDIFFRIKKYITYWLDEVDEHSLHSPFLFDFYTKVLEPVITADFDDYENLRHELLRNKSILAFQDPGAGSAVSGKKVRIKDLARTSLSSKKYSLLYYRMIRYYKPECIVELGTSLGINTLYLSEGERPVYTFEGAKNISDLAQENFKRFKRKNINLIYGNIDSTLPEFISTQKKLPFVFFDANHTYDATLRYFNICKKKADKDSIFIFDDIYWSKWMGKAWEAIKSDPQVIVSFDLYRCGIVLFNTDLNRRNFALKF